MSEATIGTGYENKTGQMFFLSVIETFKLERSEHVVSLGFVNSDGMGKGFTRASRVCKLRLTRSQNLNIPVSYSQTFDLPSWIPVTWLRFKLLVSVL
jgi:hypothetical protein